MSINKVNTTVEEQNFKFLPNQSSILYTVDTNKITINGVNVIVDKPKRGDVMCITHYKEGGVLLDADKQKVVWIDDDITKTIDILLYVMKKQLFLDGNKRTAVIFANHYLISHGKGIIVIPAELVPEYKKLLIDYYEGKNEDIIKFLYNKCLTKI